jgi:uncharacterized protein (DUF1778 family)
MPKEYIILTKQEYKELLDTLEKAENLAEELRKLSLEIRMQKFRILNKINDD